VSEGLGYELQDHRVKGMIYHTLWPQHVGRGKQLTAVTPVCCVPKKLPVNIESQAAPQTLELFFKLAMPVIPYASDAEVIPSSTVTRFQGKLRSSVRLFTIIASAVRIG
jgi:hypothetical protein